MVRGFFLLQIPASDFGPWGKILKKPTMGSGIDRREFLQAGVGAAAEIANRLYFDGFQIRARPGDTPLKRRSRRVHGCVSKIETCMHSRSQCCFCPPRVAPDVALGGDHDGLQLRVFRMRLLKRTGSSPAQRYAVSDGPTWKLHNVARGAVLTMA